MTYVHNPQPVSKVYVTVYIVDTTLSIVDTSLSILSILCIMELCVHNARDAHDHEPSP
jgi:hypothetical protein